MDDLSEAAAKMTLNREEKYAANLASILDAQKRIQSYVHVTAVLTSSSLNALAGRNLFFKCENFQKGGQGTVAVELLEQVPQLDAIFVPISGGGLISGISLAAKALKPTIKIFAAEPKGADDAAQSKAAGRIVKLTDTDTIADGLRAFLGDLTWPVVRDLVEEVITVTDSDIVKAMKMCYEQLKVVVEPSATVGLAAILSEEFQENSLHAECKNVGIVLSGGNLDLDILWRTIAQK